MLAVELQFASETSTLPTEAMFQTWAQAIPTPENTAQTVGIRVIDEQEMSALNNQYRKKQGTTNVLSFPADTPAELNIPFIGEVIICAPVVQQEADQQGKTEQSHWAHMTVHGILHLQGYDHINEAEAEQMESLEIHILQQLGFENPYR